MSHEATHDASRRTWGYDGVAVRTGLSKRTIKRMVARHEIPHIRYSARAIRFDRDAIERWIADRSKQPAPKATP